MAVIDVFMGVTDDATVITAEVSSWPYASVCFNEFSVVDVDAIDFTEYFQDDVESLRKDSPATVLNLLDYYDCKLDELPGELAEDEQMIKQAVEGEESLSLIVNKHQIEFRYERCGQADPRERNFVEEANPELNAAILKFWDEYHLNRHEEEFMAAFQNIEQLAAQNELNKEDIYNMYVKYHEVKEEL